MHRYRLLLIDTESSRERPVQAFFTDLHQAEQWATATLKVASEHAHIVFYLVTEHELGIMSKDDTRTTQAFQPPAQAAGQP